MAYITVTSADGREICRRELTANLLLGRARECDICIADARLSRKHCLFEAAGSGQWFVVDMDSRNGTLFNGEAVVRRPLRDGEEFTIGNTSVRFREGEFVAARPASPLEDLALRPSPLMDADTNITGAAATLVAASAIAPSARAAAPPKALGPAPMPQSSDSTVGASPAPATARRPRIMAAARVPSFPPPASASPASGASPTPAPRPTRLWLLLAGAGLLILGLTIALVMLVR